MDTRVVAEDGWNERLMSRVGRWLTRKMMDVKGWNMDEEVQKMHE
jgi:hypothetical protein